ncbi:MAG: sterol desaturase family protein [Actinomycetota bacterium]
MDAHLGADPAADHARRPATTAIDRRLPILIGLTALFAGRVAAQLIQAVAEVAWLPAFDAWQSGALPYPALVAGQTAILTVQVGLIRRVADGRLGPDSPTRRMSAIVGSIYGTVMAARLVLGTTVLDGHGWFDAPIPSLFHLGLAAFLVTLALPVPAVASTARRRPRPGRLLDVITYPVVMAAAVGLLSAGFGGGLPLPVAAYGAAAVAAVAITVLETVRPHRRAWRPDRRAVANDAVFLVGVQMLLPTLVSAAAVFGLSALVGDATPLRGWWPHEWPVAAQVALMLVTGDLLRYWLHRACHTWTPLWRFHAVHHSPQGLYWLNVGRFHPLEKVGQLALDSLPFVVLGVGEDVLAGYFVLYAVNGFFQHSNCRVRLGPLNWVISGPELHRWHHSRIIAESNGNYGNNLIVWDALFGTRFLPADREVDELGLLNRNYPDGFGAQLVAVFRPGLDKAAP